MNEETKATFDAEVKHELDIMMKAFDDVGDDIESHITVVITKGTQSQVITHGKVTIKSLFQTEQALRNSAKQTIYENPGLMADALGILASAAAKKGGEILEH